MILPNYALLMLKIAIAKRLMDKMDIFCSQRFVTLAEQKNKVFEQTLRQWEDKMIREGHPELVRVKHRPKPPRKPQKNVKTSKTISEKSLWEGTKTQQEKETNQGQTRR